RRSDPSAGRNPGRPGPKSARSRASFVAGSPISARCSGRDTSSTDLAERLDTVEGSVDNQPRRPAGRAPAPRPRRRAPLALAPGTHRLRVRPTARDGTTQSPAPESPTPAERPVTTSSEFTWAEPGSGYGRRARSTWRVSPHPSRLRRGPLSVIGGRR